MGKYDYTNRLPPFGDRWGDSGISNYRKIIIHPILSILYYWIDDTHMCVSLNGKPYVNIKIDISSDIVSYNPPKLIFTPDDWDQCQVVEVDGNGLLRLEGDRRLVRPLEIFIGSSSSSSSSSSSLVGECYIILVDADDNVLVDNNGNTLIASCFNCFNTKHNPISGEYSEKISISIHCIVDPCLDTKHSPPSGEYLDKVNVSIDCIVDPFYCLDTEHSPLSGEYLDKIDVSIGCIDEI